MRDLGHFAELLKTRLMSQGYTCLVLWGRDEAKNHDKQGPGTANRVVVYDGPPDDASGQWVRHDPNLSNTATREEPGQLWRWQRVTVDIWAYNQAPIETTLDGGKLELTQFRAKDWLTDGVSRACFRVLREQGHHSTFLAEVINNRSNPTGRRHGDRAILTFEIAFVSRDPAPIESDFKEAAPVLTGVVVTPTATIAEETP